MRATDQAVPRWPTGEYQQPPPARDAGNRIPPARPGKNAVTGPGNRYPGTGQQRPTRIVTVNIYERWESQAAVEAFRGWGHLPPERRGNGPSDEQGDAIVAASVAEYDIGDVRSLM